MDNRGGFIFAMYDLVLKNGFVIDPITNKEGFYDIAIENGKIAKMAPKGTNLKVKEHFDLQGLYVCPGLIDSHVHVTSLFIGKSLGYKMIAKAGVTTAVDFAGPIDEILEVMPRQGSGINLACCNALLPDNIVNYNSSSNKKEIQSFIEKSLKKGAFGIKMLGGHFPLNPETIKNTIEICNKMKIFIASHVGSTKTGSDLKGVREVVTLAKGQKLFMAHANAYCRGVINDPLLEIEEVIKLLEKSSNIYSESHLALINGTSAKCVQGIPLSRVTCNCLKSKGYSLDEKGLERAILDGYAQIMKMENDNTIKLISGEEGAKYWKDNLTAVGVSFLVNRPDSAFIFATARKDDGSFIVDVISTDGGAIPRNVLLQKGLCLIKFGAISLKEMIYKTSSLPAQLLGLSNKGHFYPGADADITVFDYEKQQAIHSLVEGKFILKNQKVIGEKGKIITTHFGEKYLKQKQIPYIRCKTNPLFMD